MPSASRSATEEEWEATTTSEVAVTTVGAASLAAPPSVVSGFSKDTTVSDLPLVVSRNSKELVEIIKELDEYFLKAADAGSHLSFLLEVPTCNFPNQKTPGKVYNYGRSLSPLVWTSFGKTDEEIAGGSFASSSSHCSTVDKLYAWEKKLYLEVKNAEGLKIEHEKRVVQLRKLEVNRAADYLKTEKLRKEVEKLESRTMVASQAIETTSAEIIKLRETEFYPQLLELVRGLMGMWRGMYQCHQVQTHIVQQLKFLNTILSTDPTSEIHRQSTLQLELEVNQWHQSFCNLVKAQLDYIQSLTGWLRLSLFQFNKTPLPKTHNDSPLYSLCEEWHHAIDRVPDKVASEGIKSFLTVIHAIVAQQAEEYKQKKRSDYAFKVFEKKMGQLRSLESKYGGPMALPRNNRDPIGEKRLKVEILRRKAEEEKNKYEKAVCVTRAMTINNLQMGFPHVFEAVTGFSSVCMHAFESVYNQAKISREDQHDVKRILP